ncbi:FkbM family methyltransferase [Bradyrhizobium manausense]|uniref:FkbM family methyltransferase n=1 Tax=Bradyrhizobium manausense TaxID=989370 RepID=UPI0020125432|nr:FkbM family methyltransferase [Bradyrhizobium manausense]
MLNPRYDHEEEIEAFLRCAADLRYSFVDCGANFGYWSVLASSRPFGRQPTLAIESSPENAKRLGANALLNGDRFRWLNAAVGGQAAGFVRITGARHEALETLRLTENEPDAVPVVSLDSLVAGGLVDASLPVVVKLDVEGVEIEALTGAERLRGHLRGARIRHDAWHHASPPRRDVAQSICVRSQGVPVQPSRRNQAAGFD